MADLLEGEVDAAVKNRAGHGYKDSKFLLCHNNTETIGDIRNQADHLRCFALEYLAVDDDPGHSRQKLA